MSSDGPPVLAPANKCLTPINKYISGRIFETGTKRGKRADKSGGPERPSWTPQFDRSLSRGSTARRLIPTQPGYLIGAFVQINTEEAMDRNFQRRGIPN
jgi:hypothetical protein